MSKRIKSGNLDSVAAFVAHSFIGFKFKNDEVSVPDVPACFLQQEVAGYPGQEA